jgi:hypothetical protein
MNIRLITVLTLIILLIFGSGCKKHNLLIKEYGKYELRDYFYSEWPYRGNQWTDHQDFCLKGTEECVYFGEAKIERMGSIAVVNDPNTLAFFNTERGFQYYCQYQVLGKREVYHRLRDGKINLVFIETTDQNSNLGHKNAEAYLYQLKFEGRQCNTQALLQKSKGVIIKNDSIDEVDGKYSYAWEWCDERCYVSWKLEESDEIKTMDTNCDPSRKIALNWKDRKPVLYVHQNTGNVNAKCDLPTF